MTENRFSAEVVRAVLHHMNDDHAADSLDIVRAFVDSHAQSAVMTGCDQFGGVWQYTTASGETAEARIEWAREALERKDLKTEIVDLLTRAQSGS